MAGSARGFRLARAASRSGVGALAAIASLALILPSAALAGPVPASTSSPGSTSWAYGASHSLSATGTAADGNTSYTLHASYGWNTLITQTNGSGGAFEVTANRTVGASLFVNYCRPDCSHATRTLNITEHAWETLLGHANFTSDGAVYSSGIPSPAIALLNSSIVEKGNLSELATARIDTLRGIADARDSVDVSVQGAVSVAFAPPGLGLFPEAPGIGENASPTNWNSSSEYSASGTWLLGLTTAMTGFLGTPSSSSISYPGSFSGATGTVTLNGSVVGPMSLHGGISADQVDETLGGPFVAWEGFILVPSGADLFAPNNAAWRPAAAGAQLASTERVDLDSSSGLGHFPVVASATSYSASATDAGSPSLETGVTSALLPGTTIEAIGQPDGPAPTTIQAEPESPSVASSSSNCLIVTCPSAPSHALPRLLLGTGIVVGLVALAIAVVVVGRQPPRRAPPSQNAKLYPPVARTPSPARPSPPASAPSADDSLGNLW